MFFETLDIFLDSMWSYIGFPMILLMGTFFTIKSKAFQIRKFPKVVKIFLNFLSPSAGESTQGIHPIGAFFTCLGGCVGIGNIVAICGAVQIGGPGALFWVWLTAFLGMTLKYGEVFLGMSYRHPNDRNGYDGGPMYYLQQIFSTLWIPNLLAILLCIYGVEIYQFNVITSAIKQNFNLNYYACTAVLLFLVIFAGSGGIRRVAHISSTVLPIFIVLYLTMGTWVLIQNASMIPTVIMQIVTSAFTGQAAIGGFAGSTVLMALSQGIRQGCYTTDVGVGYASIIHSESTVTVPSRQASLTLFDIFLDTFVICTMSILLIMVTGVWKQPVHESLLVQEALATTFPYMPFFMSFFLFLLGYSTIIAYYCVGQKCARYLFPNWGKALFTVYAVGALSLFSFADTRQAFVIMSLVGVLLLIINLYGIFRMRKKITFDFE